MKCHGGGAGKDVKKWSNFCYVIKEWPHNLSPGRGSVYNFWVPEIALVPVCFLLICLPLPYVVSDRVDIRETKIWSFLVLNYYTRCKVIFYEK